MRANTTQRLMSLLLSVMLLLCCAAPAAADIVVSDNLNQMAELVSIKDHNGQPVEWRTGVQLDSTQPYEVTLSFTESNAWQFAESGLVYQGPAGFVPNDFSGELKQGAKTVASYTIDKATGRIYVTPWYTSDNGATYHQYRESDDDVSFTDNGTVAWMEVKMDGYFTADANGQGLKFGAEAEVKVNVRDGSKDPTGNVSKRVAKASRVNIFWSQYIQLDYEMVVNTSGSLSSVVITDTIKDPNAIFWNNPYNNPVTYDPPVKNASVIYPDFGGRNFTIELPPQKYENQVIKYTCLIPYSGDNTSALTVGNNDVNMTLTGNGADPFQTGSSASYIVEPVLNKYATGNSLANDVATMNWRIDIGNGLTSIAGKVVEDQWEAVANGKDATPTLSGNVKVTVTDSDGKVHEGSVPADKISSTQTGFVLNVNTLLQDAGISSSIMPVKCIVEYTTTVALDSGAGDVTVEVNNKATDGTHTTGPVKNVVVGQSPETPMTKSIVAIGENFSTITYKTTMKLPAFYNGQGGVWIGDAMDIDWGYYLVKQNARIESVTLTTDDGQSSAITNYALVQNNTPGVPSGTVWDSETNGGFYLFFGVTDTSDLSAAKAASNLKWDDTNDQGATVEVIYTAEVKELNPQWGDGAGTYREIQPDDLAGVQLRNKAGSPHGEASMLIQLPDAKGKVDKQVMSDENDQTIRYTVVLNGGFSSRISEGALFRDVFDERLEYVPGSLMATAQYTLVNNGMVQERWGDGATYKYTGPDFEGNKIEFTFREGNWQKTYSDWFYDFAGSLNGSTPWYSWSGLSDTNFNDNTTLNHVSYTKVTLTYTLKVKDAVWNKAAASGQEIADLTNYATLDCFSGANPTTKVSKQPRIISKNYLYNNIGNNRAEYVIDINPDAIELLNGEPLSLTDTMSSAMFLDDTTLVVKVIDAAGNTSDLPKSEYSYTYTTLGDDHVLELTGLPNCKHLQVRYTVNVVSTEKSLLLINSAKLFDYDQTAVSKVHFQTNTVATAAGNKNFYIIVYKCDDADRNLLLPGATFQLSKWDTRKQDWTEPLVTITTGENGTAVITDSMVTDDIGLWFDQLYQLKETNAPDGYEVADALFFFVPRKVSSVMETDFAAQKDAIAAHPETAPGFELSMGLMANMTPTEGDNWPVNLTVTDRKQQGTPVTISKQDINANRLAGAKLQIIKPVTDEEYVPVAEWSTDNEKDMTVYLEPGVYTLIETEAPEGYEVAASIDFEVGEDGKVTVNGEETDTIVMVDKVSGYEVEISKQDIAGTKLAGATLIVAMGSGDGLNIVKRWNTTATANEVLTLEPGVYKLIEEAAPEGYEVAASIDFEVGEDGKVTVNGKETDTIVMVDKVSRYEVEIIKRDIAGTKLAGATLIVAMGSGDGLNIVKRWNTTATENEVLTLEPGVYKLIEEAAPEGYEVAASIDFEVGEDGKVTVNGEETGTIVMVDSYSDHTVTISKQDIAGNEIAGAVLKVEKQEADGTTLIETWTSEAGKSKELSLQPGTYTLTETTAPSGYKVADSITFVVGVDGKVTVNNQTVDQITMVDKYSSHEIEISKQDENGNKIGGAVLKVEKVEGDEKKLVETWTSEDGKSQELTLQPGTYILTETTAPNGYEIAESITFVVDVNGNVTVNGEETDTIVMVDSYSDHTVTVSKQDIAGNEIDGAVLKVEKVEGDEKKLVETWTSEDGKSKELTLQPGTYILTETTAPNGYEVAESITFVVDVNGNVTVNGEETDTIVMVDSYSDHTVTVSKQDIAGNEIDGAVLKVEKVEGDEKKLVETWTSEDGKSKELTLQPGTYILTETTAPNGYEVAESITFVVDVNGNVTVNGEETDTIVMVDSYSDHTVTVSKQDIAGNEIDGAVLKVEKVEGDEKKLVETWTSEAGENKELSLQPGTYILTETTAPNGYEVAESITFVVDVDGNVTVNGEKVNTIVMVDGYSDHKVAVSKQDIAGNEIDGAVLKVEKVEGDEKTLVETWTSEDGKSKELSLQPGTYILTETTAPNGYEIAESITFVVDANGNVTVNGEETDTIVMVDSYSDQTVTVSKQDITGKQIAGAQLKVEKVINDTVSIPVAKWTSVADKRMPLSLEPGTYILTETTAPNGYEIAESITFVVDVNGNVTVNGEKVNTIVMVDGYSDHKVAVSKQDIAGNEIDGAVLKVEKVEGDEKKLVETWTSEDGKSKELTLQPGTYILTETTAPNGYEIAESITFVVDVNGNVTVNGEKVNTIVMVDGYSDHKVTVSKQDIAGKQIAGAQLKVEKVEGDEKKLVETWTSEAGKSQELSLQPGTYILTETTAPNGYEIAESITFVVDVDGNVTVNGEETATIVMVDEMLMTVVEGQKTWNDAGNVGKRPGSIVIRLYADGAEVAKKVVTADAGWRWTFDNLPQYTKDGQKIIYTISEDAVAGYKSVVNGYNVTNTYVQPEDKYDYKFTFTKKWFGGIEESIDWTLYNPNGAVKHKKFNKHIVSEDEWTYEAWFETDTDYYIIENVPEGYQVVYENVGVHADVTDRCYNGGTIINYKTPQTGDTASPLLWLSMMLLGMTGMFLMARSRKRKA